MFVVPNCTVQILCMLDGLELSLQGSGRKHFLSIALNVLSILGIFLFFPKDEVTVEGSIELD